jgi:PAS domain S-box-containing protein
MEAGGQDAPRAGGAGQDLKVYRSLVDNAPVGIYRTDVGGRILYVNEALAGILEYPSAAELISSGEVWSRYRDRGDREALLERLKEEGAVKNFAVEVLTRKGKVKTVLLSGTLEGGVITGIITDITELKRMEDLIRRSMQDWQETFDTITDMITVHDRDFNIIRANRAARETLGLPGLEGMKEKCHAYYHGTASPPADCQSCMSLQSGEPVVFERYEPHLDMHIEVRVIPSLGPGGEVSALIHIVRDIGKRKRAEQALLREKGRLDDITNSINCGLLLLDAAGRISYANRVAHEWFGPGVEGRSCWELFGLDRQRCMGLESLRTGETVYGAPVRMPDRAGQERVYQVIASPVRDASGAVQQVSELVVDITERERAEKLIEAALREKEVLLREIYHRVKNNLQVVSSLLSLQARHLGDERYGELLKVSQDRIRSMALLHEKLYRSTDLSRIDLEGYIKELARDLFVSHGVDTERVALELRVEEVSLGIDTAIPCGLIINELVTNCLKHAFPGDAGGRLRISLHRAEQGEGYVLSVADDGVGLPEGPGAADFAALGLRLVSSLVEQLGGEMELGGGPGAEFVIRFRERRPAA